MNKKQAARIVSGLEKLISNMRNTGFDCYSNADDIEEKVCLLEQKCAEMIVEYDL